MQLASISPVTRIVRIGLLWLCFMAVISFSSGLAYLIGQQILRQSANDPQIQMAEDAATSLSQGTSPQTTIGSGPAVDMRKSLAAYLMVFDEEGKLQASSVKLDETDPVVPNGVFSDVKQKGESRFSWQPSAGVRSAAVLVHFGGTHPGFVLAGRSLREIEEREDNLLKLTGVAWVGGLVASLVVAGSLYLVLSRRELITLR